MIDRLQRLLEIVRGIRVRGSRERFAARLSEVAGRLVPEIRRPGVVGEPLGVLAQAIPVECLDGPNDLRVKLATALLQQAGVGHLMRERVLEGIFPFRVEPGLVEKLGGLQAVEPATQRLAGSVGDRLEDRKRQVFAHDRGDLQEALGLRGDRSMRAASITWTVGGTWIAWTGCVSRYRPRSPTSAFVSTSVRTVSSRKNGFPRLTRSCLSGVNPGSSPRSASSSSSALSAGSASSRIWL